MRRLAHDLVINFHALIQAFQLLTVIPFMQVPYTESSMRRSLVFYPLVGAVLGFIFIIISYVLTILFPPLISGMILLIFWVMLTGGLHIDGLMDTADGLLSHRPREQMLVIMRDSRVGAWGVVTCVLLLMLKAALFITLTESLQANMHNGVIVWGAFILFPVLSRMMMVWAVIAWPYAREDGGFGTALQQAGKKEGFVATGFALLITGAVWLICGLNEPLLGFIVTAWGLALVSGIGLASYIQRKLGGLTGDTYGALNEMIEVIVLLVAVVWFI